VVGAAGAAVPAGAAPQADKQIVAASAGSQWEHFVGMNSFMNPPRENVGTTGISSEGAESSECANATLAVTSTFRGRIAEAWTHQLMRARIDVSRIAWYPSSAAHARVIAGYVG
jgi:hypothetical protein